MSKNRSGQFIGGLLLGAAIGTVTGILIAPRSGRQTRQLVKKSVEALPELAEDLSTSVQIQADRLSDSTRSNWDETLDRLRQAISAGLEAGAREREAFSHKGAKNPAEAIASGDEGMDSDNGVPFSPATAASAAQPTEILSDSESLRGQKRASET